ncbi:PorT family protein [Cognataquiflexum rubidum]|uniref:PorT family protein n=1 Tax=Cognataquiflexum rubidum TaxID=2922273 RepID=UPI001F12D540|nr:PorT family protein [Cognataquiflexum rubidum]MCH6234220.1 PorT family protein [Cognataquiflexum rubidum]
MKIRSILIFVLISFSHNSWAQMEKGSWIIRGNVGVELGFTNSSYENTSNPTSASSNNISHTYTFSPGLAYMLNDKWMAGVEGLFNRRHFGQDYIYNEFNEGWGDQYLNTSGIGVFARKFFELDENLQLFGETGIGVSGYSEKHINSINSITNGELQTIQSYRNYGMDLSIGLHYRFLNNLSIEMNMPLMGYGITESKSIQNDLGKLLPVSSGQSFMIMFGRNYQVGINFIF